MEEFCRNDDDSKIATVIAILRSPVTDGKTVLIVEGADDVSVYSRFFSAQYVELYPDGCCDTHCRILKSLNPNYKARLAAIKDADFDRLNGKRSKYDNLFLTDGHDLENMILREGIPALVIGEYRSRCNNIDLQEIHRGLEMISYLRWMNNDRDLCLNFKALSLATYCVSPYRIDFERYLSDLLHESKRASVSVTLSDVEVFAKSHYVNDMSDLTRGHDLLECIYIRAKDASAGNFPKKKFFKKIRDAYSVDMFSRTSLCHEICSYRNDMLISDCVSKR
mgnify:CR=1 FL=1